MLELLLLAARIEGDRYEPVTREADCSSWRPPAQPAPERRSSSSLDAVARSLAALQLAAARHGGAEVQVTVDGPKVRFEPVSESAAPIVLGEEQRDLGAAVAVMLVRSLGGEVALDGDQLTVTLPTK